MEHLTVAFSKFTVWDQRFLTLADHIASWSRDPSTRVGCVIAQGKRVVGMGFNGFPQGVDDAPERYADRDVKLAMVVHAEANALLFAGHSTIGATMYCTLMPCSNCAGLIIQGGIKKVVAPYPNKDHIKRWAASFDTTARMLEEAGVELVLGVHE